MAIIKQSTFPAFGPSGEPLVRLLSDLPGYGDSLEKTAGVHPEILAYKSQLEPEPGKTYVHILALGAGEYYGANLNNDHFPWAGLQHDHTRTPHPHMHGYKTFLNAHAFAHHMNKDPEKAYGDVLLSVLNTKMKRVELIVAIDEEKCIRNGGAKTLERIKAGEYPSTSMGCRVPFDVCSICGHQARYRSEYCQHMLSEAGKIYADGRKVFVYNPYPRFFDISFVFIGADRTSFVLERIGVDQPQQQHAEQGGAEKVAYIGQGIVDTVKGWNWTTQGMIPRFVGGAAFGGLTGAMTADDEQRAQGMFRGALAGGLANATIGQVAKSGIPGAMGLGLTAGGAVANMGGNPPPPPLTSTLDPANTDTSLNPGHSKHGHYMRANTKHASVKAAEVQKVSDIFKDVNSLPMGRAVPMLTRNEPDMPDQMLDRVAQSPDLGETLGGMGAAGVVLKPHEFQRVVLVRTGQPQMAEQLRCGGVTFDPSASAPIFSQRMVVRPPDVGGIPLGLMDMLRTILPMRSSLTPLGVRRQITITISMPTPTPVQDPFLDKLAGLYNGYRESLLTNAEGLLKTAMHTPALMQDIAKARGGHYDGPPDMRALAELPMAYFSHAYWNRCCCDRSLSDTQFAEKFVDENPEIAKYLARVVADRYDPI